MTAATKTTPDEKAREAHAVVHAALTALRGPVTYRGRQVIGSACRDTDDALEIYALLASRAMHWEAVYPELSASADPDAEALEKAADEAENAADALIRAIAAHCGPVTADEIEAAVNWAAEGGRG